ncbi:S-methyl-5-thioribose-1-phosphate isomerase [Gonapodya sp. JEL0774]|nr:S-methyl-5-thioribose-1-phosphate isomerase [Gonapodya sp. JEL0774]
MSLEDRFALERGRDDEDFKRLTAAAGCVLDVLGGGAEEGGDVSGSDERRKRAEGKGGGGTTHNKGSLEFVLEQEDKILVGHRHESEFEMELQGVVEVVRTGRGWSGDAGEQNGQEEPDDPMCDCGRGLSKARAAHPVFLHHPALSLFPPHSAIKYSTGSLAILNQLLLPWESFYEPILDAQAGHAAIKTMKRLLILVLWLSHTHSRPRAPPPPSSLTPHTASSYILSRLAYLVTSRPTAVNLADAAAKLSATVLAASQSPAVASLASSDPVAAAKIVLHEYVTEAEKMMDEDVRDNRNIGRYGAQWIIDEATRRNGNAGDKIRVLTHCNTGSLATAGWGTALGIIRDLHATGKLEMAYCTETRPYNQGSRLTAYELVHEGIPATLITDSMASHLLLTHSITAIVVGADRVTRTGDTANKIGTYQLAIAARYHHVPFVVAAPATSVDLETKSGKEIVIEQRSGVEVVTVRGRVVEDEGAVKEPGGVRGAEGMEGRRSGSRTVAVVGGSRRVDGAGGDGEVDVDGEGEGDVDVEVDVDVDMDGDPSSPAPGPAPIDETPSVSVIERLGAKVDKVVQELEAAVFGVETDEMGEEEEEEEEGTAARTQTRARGSGGRDVGGVTGAGKGNGHASGTGKGNGRAVLVDDEADDGVTTCLVRIAADGIGVWNPAFDVTPASLITAIVTEKGVAVKKEGQEEFDMAGFLSGAAVAVEADSVEEAAEDSGADGAEDREEEEVEDSVGAVEAFEGPPDEVLEMGTFMHACENQMVCRSTNVRIPYFNAPIYLENKTQIGKVDEILGPLNEVYFSVSVNEGFPATSFKQGDKVFIGSDKLLPIERFLPKPKGAPKGEAVADGAVEAAGVVDPVEVDAGVALVVVEGVALAAVEVTEVDSAEDRGVAGSEGGGVVHERSVACGMLHHELRASPNHTREYSTISRRSKATPLEPLVPPPSTIRIPEPPPKPTIEPPPSFTSATNPTVSDASTPISGTVTPSESEKVVLGPQKPEPDTAVRKLLHEQLRMHPKLKDSAYYQKLMKEREQLFKEAFDEGYWDDMKGAVYILTVKNAKFAEAPTDLIPFDLAPTLPVLSGQLLSGGTTDPISVATKHKVTFVGIMFSKFAEVSYEKYPINKVDGIAKNPHIGLLLINVEENSAKAWVQSAFKWLMKRSTPKIMQVRLVNCVSLSSRVSISPVVKDRYMFYPHSLSEYRRSLGLFNKYLGYAMLVDRWGKVRWMAHGPASERELKFLLGDAENGPNAVDLLVKDVDTIMSKSRRR